MKESDQSPSSAGRKSNVTGLSAAVLSLPFMRRSQEALEAVASERTKRRIISEIDWKVEGDTTPSVLSFMKVDDISHQIYSTRRSFRGFNKTIEKHFADALQEIGATPHGCFNEDNNADSE